MIGLEGNALKYCPVSAQLLVLYPHDTRRKAPKPQSPGGRQQGRRQFRSYMAQIPEEGDGIYYEETNEDYGGKEE